MWWIYQIIACLLVALMQMFNRWSGINAWSRTKIWLIDMGIEATAIPMFIISYTMAPGFFQPWFLGTAVIAVAGFIGSLIFFGEVITITKLLGAALALIGAALLIL